MQNHAWVALLRHIPPDQHCQYLLVTTGHTEISIQSLLRIEPECVVIKGRLAGTQETGRIFFIPYDHIDYFGTQQAVKDTDFNEVFNSLVMPAAGPPPEEEAGVLDSAPANPDSGQRPSIRSEVLDRYRSRPSSSALLPDARGNGK